MNTRMGKTLNQLGVTSKRVFYANQRCFAKPFMTVVVVTPILILSQQPFGKLCIELHEEAVPKISSVFLEIRCVMETTLNVKSEQILIRFPKCSHFSPIF